MIQIGSVINKKYKLIDQIGFGGMSTVYLSRDLTTGETFAIKVMDYKIVHNKEFLDRFEREAKIGVTLDHPNIAKVLSYGKEDGTYYIVMEYVKGINIRQYMRQYGNIGWQRAVQIIYQVLAALSYAYHKGLQAHRDIKPENIMVDTATLTIKVMDFGIAKLEGSELIEDSLIYTPHYASPEQLMPSKFQNKISFSTDLFCLSIVFYEMLTGKIPFPGNTSKEIIDQELSTHPKSPTDINPQIPLWISNIIMKSLMPNPESRHQTPEEMAYELKNKRIGFNTSLTKQKIVNSYQKSYSDSNDKSKKMKNLYAVLIPAVSVFVIISICLLVGIIKYLSPKFGNVNVTTNPDNATIYIDGVPYNQKTPTIITKLEAGYHNITIKKEGFYDVGDFIKIDPNQTFPYEGTLKPIPKLNSQIQKAYLVVTTNPDGVGLYLNNVYKGISLIPDPSKPLSPIELPPGEYELLLKKPGYESENHKIVIKPGETKKLHYAMELIPPTISKKEAKKKELAKPQAPPIKPINENGIAVISSEPPDALVYINGLCVGSTPVEIREKTGTYQLRLTRLGYKDTPVMDIKIPNNEQRIEKKVILVLDIDAPKLKSPSNNQYDLNLIPTFSWLPVNKAEYYELLITDNGYKQTVFSKKDRQINDIQFELPFGYLQPGRFYTWAIRAGNKYGQGPFSEIWTFSTERANTPKPPTNKKSEYSVTFRSDPPDARIYIDEKPPIGDTNGTYRVPAGTHKVWIWKDGYKRFERIVTFDKDGLVFIATLVKE
jgi:serine/threonine protein kinase